MASIKERSLKDGSTVYKITVLISKDKEGGSMTRRSMTVRPESGKKTIKKAELDRIAYEFEQKCKGKQIIDDRRITLREYAEKWLESYAKSNVAETTASKYKNQLEKMILPHIGHLKMAELKPSTVAELLKTLEEDGYDYGDRHGSYSKRSIGDAKATLSTLCTSAVLDNLLASNPCTAVRRRSRKEAVMEDTPKAFSLEQAQRFLDIIEKPLPIISPAHTVTRRGKVVQIREYVSGHYSVALKYKCAFQLAIFAGFRAEECCGLIWKDVDFKDGTIKIERAAVHVNGKTIVKAPKSAAGYRKINLPPTIMKNLQELRHETMKTIVALGTAWKGPRNISENPVFCQVEGGRMNRSTLNKELHRVIRSWNAGCKDDRDTLPELTFHQLRHTSATLLIAEGIEPTAIAARLGHSDASITLSIYAHSFEERDQEASNALENALLNKKDRKAT